MRAVAVARCSRSGVPARRSEEARLCARPGAWSLNRRVAAEKRGRGAERVAAWWLRLHGWRILAQRARVPGGEVDLVARRGRTLAFVEVKARGTEEGLGLSLDEYRLRRVVVAAERLAPRYARNGDDIRIDAIFIMPGRVPQHLVNIWHG